VLEVNEPLKRISLTMKSPGKPAAAGPKSRPAAPKPATIEDLKAKFNQRRS
jgi:hypothetical protein